MSNADNDKDKDKARTLLRSQHGPPSSPPRSPYSLRSQAQSKDVSVGKGNSNSSHGPPDSTSYSSSPATPTQTVQSIPSPLTAPKVSQSTDTPVSPNDSLPPTKDIHPPSVSNTSSLPSSTSLTASHSAGHESLTAATSACSTLSSTSDSTSSAGATATATVNVSDTVTDPSHDSGIPSFGDSLEATSTPFKLSQDALAELQALNSAKDKIRLDQALLQTQWDQYHRDQQEYSRRREQLSEYENDIISREQNAIAREQSAHARDAHLANITIEHNLREKDLIEKEARLNSERSQLEAQILTFQSLCAQRDKEYSDRQSQSQKTTDVPPTESTPSVPKHSSSTTSSTSTAPTVSIVNMQVPTNPALQQTQTLLATLPTADVSRLLREHGLQSSSSDMRPTAKEPPSFHGTAKENFNRFVREVDRYSVAVGWSDQQTARYAPFMLKGRALQVYDDIPAQHKNSWTALVTHMRTIHPFNDNRAAHAFSSLNRTQGQQESVSAYTHDMLNVFADANMTDEELKVWMYIKGLLPTLRAFVMVQPCKNMAEAETAALKAEMAHNTGTLSSATQAQQVNYLLTQPTSTESSTPFAPPAPPVSVTPTNTVASVDTTPNQSARQRSNQRSNQRPRANSANAQPRPSSNAPMVTYNIQAPQPRMPRFQSRMRYPQPARFRYPSAPPRPYGQSFPYRQRQSFQTQARSTYTPASRYCRQCQVPHPEGQHVSPTCYHCGQPGHLRSQCPLLGVSRPPPTNPAANSQCFGCGEYGHFRAQCPHNSTEDTSKNQDRE